MSKCLKTNILIQLYFHSSIQYDVNSLAISVARLIFGDLLLTFYTCEELISKLNQEEELLNQLVAESKLEYAKSFIVPIKMIKIMLDTKITNGDVKNFLKMCRNVYDYALKNMSFVGEEEHLKVLESYSFR